jgi:hypothetical protein
MKNTIENQQILTRLLKLTLYDLIDRGHVYGLGSTKHFDSLVMHRGKSSIFHHFMTSLVLNSNDLLDFGVRYKKCWQRSFAIEFLAGEVIGFKRCFDSLYEVDWKRYKYHYTEEEINRIIRKKREIKDEYAFVLKLYENATQ